MTGNGAESAVTRARSSWVAAVQILRRYGGKEWRRILAGLVLITLQSGLTVLTPWPIGMIIDGALGGGEVPDFVTAAGSFISTVTGADGPMALVLALAGGLLLLHFLAGALVVVSHYVLVSTGLRMVTELRCVVFDHVQRLSLRFHDTTTVGDSLYKVTWDTYCVQSLFNGGLVPCLTQTVTLLGICGAMFSSDPLAAAIALAVGVPLVILIRKVERPMTERSMQAQERESAISARVQETLSGIRAVQAFGREDFETARFRVHANASLKANLRLTLLQATSQGVVGLVIAAGVAAIVVLGAHRCLAGEMKPGALFMLITWVAMIHNPLQTLTYAAVEVQKSAAGARRVLDLLDAVPDVRDAADARELPGRAQGRVGFESVGFSYRKGEPVLEGVNLEVAPGRTVALVGASGAGKTTLVSLALRFYDPTQGKITIDGQDLRSLKLSSLRGNMAIVLQDPVLFSSSIRENIAYGRQGATEAEVIDAAKAAAAHDFIMELPEGYDTPIGERGVSLSGGQRQRISIARAFLKNAPVLIMDEPTSALDAGTERVLMEATRRLMAGRTTLIIAHRLSTIRDAHVIVAMDKGRIMELGSHQELLAKGGLYSRLYLQQMREPVQEPSGEPT